MFIVLLLLAAAVVRFLSVVIDSGFGIITHCKKDMSQYHSHGAPNFFVSLNEKNWFSSPAPHSIQEIKIKGATTRLRENHYGSSSTKEHNCL